MTGAAITVRRQILDVDVFGEESDGVLLQRRLPAVCADVVAPALEAGFAGVDLGDERLCIDRIAIELEGVDIERLETELVDAVRRGVGDYLRDHPLAPLGGVLPSAPDGAHRTTERETIDDALVLFLRTGRLPWSFRTPRGEQFEAIVLRAWGDAGARPSPGLRRRLADAFAIPAARSRLVLQFTPHFAVTLLRELSPQVASVSGEVLAVLSAETIPPSLRRRFGLRVWDAALVAAVRGANPSPADVIRTAATTAELPPAEARMLAALYEANWVDAAQALLGAVPPVRSLGETSNHGGPAPLAGSAEGGTTAPRSRASRAAPDTPARQNDSALAEETEGILVEQAGIVLLHPYLQRFFAGLGVAEGDELVDSHRAVCLLHLLGTGEMTAPEHRVTLAKALCGIPLDEPVPADVGLAEADAEEARALLDAVIEHWGALGSSSPDGLREGFLQRDGVLSVDAWGDWLLRVETTSLDILLDDLPWGVSVLTLPWMERRLIVEWR